VAQQMTLAVAGADIVQRIIQRLLAIPPAGAPPASQIVWSDKGDTVLVHVDSLKARFTDGWLLCSLDLESDQTGRQTLQLFFFLGNSPSAGASSAGVVNAPAPGAAALANRWGPVVQRIIWDAVLDSIEAAVYKAGVAQPSQKLTVGGYFATDAGLNVGISAGAI
jgi:hypothetical protein